MQGIDVRSEEERRILCDDDGSPGRVEIFVDDLEFGVRRRIVYKSRHVCH